MLPKASMCSSATNDGILCRTETYASDVLARLNQYRLERKFTDAILCVGQEEFPCHRSVLAVSSPYFDAMFSSDLQEGRESKVTYDSGMSPWVIKRIIEYAYSGVIEIGPDNAQEYLRTGHLLDYPAIVEASALALSRHLHPSNCLGLRELARLYGCQDLEASARQHVLENFMSVIECEEFVEATPCEALVEYLSSDTLEVASEDVACNAALRWVAWDVERRRARLHDLLRCVRLTAMDSSALKRLLCEPLVRNQPECMELIHRALHTCLATPSVKLPSSSDRALLALPFQHQPRPSTLAKDVVLVVGGTSSYAAQTCVAYEPLRRRWHRLPDVPACAAWSSVVAVSSGSDAAVAAAVLVTGGIVENLVTDRVWRLCPKARSWRSSTPLLTPRARHASAHSGRRLFVVGGVVLKGHAVLPGEDIESYDLAAEQWTRVGRSPSPRQLSHLLACGRTLYEVGGASAEGRHLGTMEMFSMEVNDDGPITVKHAGMHFVLPVTGAVDSAGYARAVLHEGTLYVLWESSRQMIALTPEKGIFRVLPSCSQARLHCSMIAMGGHIYVVGGLVDGKPSSLVECYDPASAKWAISHMPEERACHSCVSVKMFST